MTKKKEVAEPSLWEQVKQIWKDLWTKAKTDILVVWDLFKDGLITFLDCVYNAVYGIIDIFVGLIGSFIKSVWKLIYELLIKWIKG